MAWNAHEIKRARRRCRVFRKSTTLWSIKYRSRPSVMRAGPSAINDTSCAYEKFSSEWNGIIRARHFMTRSVLKLMLYRKSRRRTIISLETMASRERPATNCCPPGKPLASYNHVSTDADSMARADDDFRRYMICQCQKHDVPIARYLEEVILLAFEVKLLKYLHHFITMRYKMAIPSLLINKISFIKSATNAAEYRYQFGVLRFMNEARH